MPNRIINERYLLKPNPHTGGMSEVYQGIELNEYRQVAVKIFKHQQIEKDILAESFRREVNALKDLKHPGIVELIDSGIDEETGHNFLVLEWMEKDLTKRLKESPLEGWDSFWHDIGSTLLEALAFSHNREYIHRDIKPSNILINSEGTIKLADFGISKLKRYLQPTVTLREFASRPYTPPEVDDGSYSYTRDVFSFGVVTLKCLTDVEIFDNDSLQLALNQFDAPSEVIEVIERTVSPDPANRQHNAEVLLSELKAIQDLREKKHPTQKQKCYLKLIPNFIDKNASQLKADSQDEIQKIILQDLNTACGICRYEKHNTATPEKKYEEGQYKIYGADYSYHVKVDDPHSDLLVILNMKNLSSTILEENREKSWNPPYEFKFERFFNQNEAKKVIRELRLAVEEYEASLRQKEAEDEKQRLFRVWDNILRAKKDWEKNHQPPLKYTQVSRDGNRAIFKLESLPDEDIVGQPRHVALPDGRSLLSGDVEEIKDDLLILYINNGDPKRISQSGELRFDNRAAESALRQQTYALDAIKYDRAVRPDIRYLIINPKKVKSPKLDENIQFIQSLNFSQQETVKSALATEDFLIVQGPPGTGKTTFITEVIFQTLQKNPDTRILLTSQTHVALDNALERIQALNPSLKMIRIGNHVKVSERVHPLLLEEQMEQWRNEVFTKSQNFIKNWSEQHQLPQEDIEMANLFQELRNNGLKLHELRKQIEAYKQEKYEISQQKELKGYFDESNFYTPDIISEKNLPEEIKNQVKYLDEKMKNLEEQSKIERNEQKKTAETLYQLSKIEPQELLKMSEADLEQYENILIDSSNLNAKKLQKLMKIQQEWFEIFGRSDSDRFNAALLKRSQIIAGTCIGLAKYVSDVEFDLCIVDEASKATATELLVPIARSRRWILVGDPKQLPPFQDEASRDATFLSKYSLTPEEIKETLFAYLLRTLPESNRKILTIQHRMIAPIGDLISDCFYQGQIESTKKDIDIHLNAVFPKPVTWLTTTKLPNCREQSVPPSFNNICEVNVIIEILKKLNKMAVAVAAEKPEKSYSVAILTGYSAQLKLLKRKLDSELSNWDKLTVQCNTVDAFQGQEADIAIYSVTRSNTRSEFGFLRDVERMNVALSRGKVGLVIVGDHQFCRTSNNPLRTVLEYIDSHPETCCLQEAK